MKKTICILLSLFMTFSLFAACSKDESSDEKNESSASDFALKYTYDAHYSTLDESAKRAFEKVADAIVNGEETASFNLELLDDVNCLLYTGFPLMALVESVTVLPDNTGVQIKYKNEKDKHLQLAAAFTAKVGEIMTACQFGKVSNDVFVLNAYHYVAQNTVYDNASTDTYSAIMTGKGMSAAISGMFEYLVQQAGVDASHMVGKDAAGSPWFFSRAKLGGQIYNFDIASELSVRKGEGLTCFAMTDKELTATGVQKDFTYTDGKKAGKIELEENKFSPLRSCAYYELKGNVIHAALYSGETKDITL